MYYTVYKIENLKNHKFYIGCHITDDLDDGYMGSGLVIRKAIDKYGAGNFKKKYLGIFDNKESMFAVEKDFIDVDNPLCYNIHEGGKGGFEHINKAGLNRSKKQIESSAKALSNKWKNDKEYSSKMKKVSSNVCKKLWKEGKMNIKGNIGYKHTEESKLKMSKAKKGIKPWNVGKHHTEETKRKISLSLKLNHGR